MMLNYDCKVKQQKRTTIRARNGDSMPEGHRKDEEQEGEVDRCGYERLQNEKEIEIDVSV